VLIVVTSEQTLTKGFLCSAVVLNILTDTVVHTLHVSSYSPDVIRKLELPSRSYSTTCI